MLIAADVVQPDQAARLCHAEVVEAQQIHCSRCPERLYIRSQIHFGRGCTIFFSVEYLAYKKTNCSIFSFLWSRFGNWTTFRSPISCSKSEPETALCFLGRSVYAMNTQTNIHTPAGPITIALEDSFDRAGLVVMFHFINRHIQFYSIYLLYSTGTT